MSTPFHMSGIFQSKSKTCDFPGGPVVENLPSSTGGQGSILGWEGRVPDASWAKHHSIKSILQQIQ